MPAFLFFLFPKLTPTILSSLHGNQMWTWQRHGFPKNSFHTPAATKMISARTISGWHVWWRFGSTNSLPWIISRTTKGSVVEQSQGETAMLTGTRAEEHRSSKNSRNSRNEATEPKENYAENRTWAGAGVGWGGAWGGRVAAEGHSRREALPNSSAPTLLLSPSP